MTTMEKLRRLQEDLQRLGKVAVAFSGGVDSTFLLKVAHDVLGDGVLAVTACSASFPSAERVETADFCRREGIRRLEMDTDEMRQEDYLRNDANRCYYCKRTLFTRLLTLAREQGVPWVAEGSNADDAGDYRPGLRAIEELGVLSPLRAAGLTKEEIRTLSRSLGLPTWDKPAAACLASRIPYGQRITPQALARVDAAEQALRAMGFSGVRVRAHGDLARVEVPPEQLDRLLQADTRQQVDRALKQAGFVYAAADLTGYRTGSLNEVLKEEPSL